MNLLEHEAKSILSDYGIAVPRRVALLTRDGVNDAPEEFPVVLKSQVPIGGRGKLGGIKVVHDATEFHQTIEPLIQREIRGFTPRHILVEQALEIEAEYYLSLTINRELGTIEMIAHRQGGVEIEEQVSDDLLRRPLDTVQLQSISQALADLYDLPDKVFLLEDLLSCLLRCFMQNDAALIEINPLALTHHGELIAADCKMTLDDAAAFRHPEWQFEEQVSDNNFVSLNPRGTIATIANGAGLAMATVDAVARRGLVPANFLDIGGGATVESIVASFRRIMEFSEVKYIVINIFGGIVQCDQVAQAIVEARSQLPDLPQLLIRLSGTNAEQARRLLAKHELPLYDSLEAALEEISS